MLVAICHNLCAYLRESLLLSAIDSDMACVTMLLSLTAAYPFDSLQMSADATWPGCPFSNTTRIALTLSMVLVLLCPLPIVNLSAPSCAEGYLLAAIESETYSISPVLISDRPDSAHFHLFGDAQQHVSHLSAPDTSAFVGTGVYYTLYCVTSYHCFPVQLWFMASSSFTSPLPSLVSSTSLDGQRCWF